MSVKQFISNNRRMVSGMGFVGLIPLTVSSIITAFLVRNQDYLQSLNVEQWFPLYILSVLTMALAITPTTFIALVSGYFLGWQCAPAVIIAYLLASALGFMVGKSLDGGRFLNSFSKFTPESTRFHQIINEMKKKDWLLMILVRISPILPFSLINLLLPATGIRLHVFITGGFIGMLPRTLFSIWVGIQAQNIVQLFQNPENNNTPAVLFILTTLVSAGGLFAIFIRASTRLINDNHS